MINIKYIALNTNALLAKGQETKFNNASKKFF